MNTMGPMGGGVQNQPAPPYRQTSGKPGTVGVTGVGTSNVGLQQNQQFQQVNLLYYFFRITYLKYFNIELYYIENFDLFQLFNII